MSSDVTDAEQALLEIRIVATQLGELVQVLMDHRNEERAHRADLALRVRKLERRVPRDHARSGLTADGESRPMGAMTDAKVLIGKGTTYASLGLLLVIAGLAYYMGQGVSETNASITRQREELERTNIALHEVTTEVKALGRALQALTNKIDILNLDLRRLPTRDELEALRLRVEHLEGEFARLRDQVEEKK